VRATQSHSCRICPTVPWLCVVVNVVLVVVVVVVVVVVIVVVVVVVTTDDTPPHLCVQHNLSREVSVLLSHGSV